MATRIGATRTLHLAITTNVEAGELVANSLSPIGAEYGLSSESSKIIPLHVGGRCGNAMSLPKAHNGPQAISVEVRLPPHQ